jgi:hypothetical protein
MTKNNARFRKQILIPTEHGSWSWLFVPYFIGLGIAQTFSLATFLVLVAGLSVFLMRQPGMVWSRARSGHGRRSDGPIAAKVLAGLVALALLALAGLFLLGITDILWLTVPTLIVVALYLTAARNRRSRMRVLGMEIVGAAGLALMAPAVLIAAHGQATPMAWVVFSLAAWQNVLSVFYVRQRIADTHERESNRLLSLVGHLLGAGMVGGTAVLQFTPWLAALPFLGFLIRAIWVYIRPRPIPHIKKFGFTELAVQFGAGFVIVLGYWLS